MIQEHRMRFYREVAEHTRRIAEQDGIERIILGGGEQASHAVKKQLPQIQQEQVLDVVSIPRHYSAHDIFEHVQPLALEYERQTETELVDDVIDAARAGGRAMLGPEAVDHALTNGQVSHLILAWPPDDQDGANDLAYRALQLNSQITMVHGDPADKLRKEGSGVAARLYYTM
jgi:peptide subunit release factor 1 (eRF1)